RDAEPPEPMVSPVEASARYLMHLRNAWNHAMTAEGATNPQQLFENQEIVLAVPASFDEEARELTVEAARQAGLQKLTLLEEPLAAFYAWIATNRGSLKTELHGGDVVLVCDVGGGTSDFSLIQVHIMDGEVQFERTAIGEHLLLGGDNLDLALARRIEEKLDHPKLSLAQQQALHRTCCAIKERLLINRTLKRLPVTILGSGRSIVGGALTAELTRDEVLETLTNGFLPVVAPDDLPVREKRTGLREIGLPYVREAAITRHLAAFLTQAGSTTNRGGDVHNHHDPGTDGMSLSHDGAQAAGPQLSVRRMVRPDAILFNGGFFAPAVARQKFVEAVSS